MNLSEHYHQCFNDYSNMIEMQIEKELFSRVSKALYPPTTYPPTTAKFVTPTSKLIAAYKIKNVIFNNPYTIVFWQDGTKTTVTCGAGDVFDEEKGIFACITKKLYGNKGSYIDNIKPFLTENVEKEKTRLAEKKKKVEADAKALEEKRKQRHIKNLAKKRIRQEKHDKQVQTEYESLSKKAIEAEFDKALSEVGNISAQYSVSHYGYDKRIKELKEQYGRDSKKYEEEYRKFKLEFENEKNRLIEESEKCYLTEDDFDDADS